jgi:small subunit ribosomal protein S18
MWQCASVDKVKSLDYKDVKRLEAFITERGKIVSSRFSGNCARHQRMLAEVIKKARFVSLVPYIR